MKSTTISCMILRLGFLIPLLLRLTGACPSSCKCTTVSFYTKAVCRGGTISDILTGLPPNTRDVEISSASGTSTLSPTLFGGHNVNSITTLKLTDSFIQQIDTNAFASFTSLVTLNLSQNRIRTISKNAFGGLSRLQTLDLSQNSIKILDDKFSPLTQLRKLDLSKNSITSINSAAFRMLILLIELNLSWNRLQNLHGYVFQGLQNLRILRLQHCDMHSVPNDLFSVMRNIQELDISWNQIYKLPSANVLAGLPALNYLIAEHNQISFLDNNQFSGINLIQLNLAYNRISSISSSAFKTFNTRHLDLSHNSISSISEAAFRDISPQLLNLSLSSNPLKNIPLHVFDSLYRLVYLNLSICSLIDLEEGQFNSLQQLRNLDLSRNHLGFIPNSIVRKFSQLQELVLYQNPWHCDCHIRPMRNWLQSSNVMNILLCRSSSKTLTVSIECRNLRCISPAPTAGQLIGVLSDEAIHECSTSVSNHGLSVGASIGIGISCFIVFAIVLIVSICCCRYLRRKRSPVGGRQPSGCMCAAESQDSSHKEYREKSTTPFKDGDAGSLNESDKDYVVQRYFRSMVSQPSYVSRGTPSVSHKEFDFHASCPSLAPSIASAGSVFEGPIGYESTV